MDQEQKKVPEQMMMYLRRLMEEHGDSILPEKVQSQIMFDLYLTFNEYLMFNVAKSLEKEKLKEFQQLVASGSSEDKIRTFIEKNTDLKKITKETMAEVRDNYLGKLK